MKILGAEIDFNFNDADDVERLENAIDETQKKLNNIDITGKRTSKVIRETCTIIFDCFNKVFGEGTDKKIFGSKTNFNICLEAFKDLYNARDEQATALEEEIKNLESKYSPNRATRRAKK